MAADLVVRIVKRYIADSCLQTREQQRLAVFNLPRWKKLANFHQGRKPLSREGNRGGLTHWTSHEKRCNRKLGKRFGDSAYAMEELVAELGATFLCAELGITTEPRADHAQYLASWLTVLKADKRAIFTAASKASEAADGLNDIADGLG